MMNLLIGIASLISLVITYQRRTTLSFQDTALGTQGTEKPAVGPRVSYIVHFMRDALVMRTHGKLNCAEEVLWCLNYIYHYLVAKIFFAALLLNMVNLMTVIIEFIIFCQTVYQKIMRCPEQKKDKADDILFQTRDYWEFILAGSVLIQLFLSGGD